MGVFKKFVTELSYDEYRKMTLSPCRNKRRSSYLKKEDLTSPHYDFPKKLPEDKSQLEISKIKLSDDEEEVKKLTKRM